MPNFKTCKNGHNYDTDQYSECPFCPANSQATDYEKTLTDFKNTQLFDEGNDQQFNKTILSEDTADFKITPVHASFKRTSIVMQDKEGVALEQSERRKLAGWLVTFTNNEYGQDFKIYAGKNRVGSAAGCDIIIQDPSISGEHSTILFRDNEFLIKDNFSTNGTKINGASVDEGKLKDGDELKLGNTIFRFKTAF